MYINEIDNIVKAEIRSIEIINSKFDNRNKKLNGILDHLTAALKEHNLIKKAVAFDSFRYTHLNTLDQYPLVNSLLITLAIITVLLPAIGLLMLI